MENNSQTKSSRHSMMFYNVKREEELKRNLGKKAGQGHAPEVQKW